MQTLRPSRRACQRDREVEDGHVSFRGETTPASRPAAEQIKRDCEDRLRSVPGVHALTIRLEGEIPIDPKIVLGGDSGTPIVALEPESAAARAYGSVAEAVAKSLGAGPLTTGFSLDNKP